MDTLQFNSLIETALGGNLVDVELGIQDYAQAYSRAKSKWIQYANANTNEQYAALTLQPSQMTYDLSAFNPQIDTITKIVSLGSEFNTNDLFSVATFNELFNGLLTGSSIDLLTLEETYQYIKLLERYTVSSPDFIWNRRTLQLNLLREVWTQRVVFLHCYCYETDSTLMSIRWIQDWAISEAKIILGMAYQKFSSIQGPAGNAGLPGAALIESAQADQQRLITEIADYVDGDPASGFLTMG